MNAKKLSTWDVLRNKFPANEYVLLKEVSDQSGFSRSRSLDFMLINLWASRGFSIHGIEQKSNRGDWLKELKAPAKQENHFKYCDYFWLLTDKEGVAKIEEIPPTWGWYHIKENGTVRTMKNAPKLKPVEINRSFMCAMFRRATDVSGYVLRSSIEEEIIRQVELRAKHIDYERDEYKRKYESLLALLKDFEEHSGVLIHDDWRSRYKIKDIGIAVDLIVKHGLPKQINDVKEFSERLKKISLNIDNSLELIQQQHTETINQS